MQHSQKKAEEKLNPSGEGLNLAMRGANDGVWDWNLETDEVYYSPRWKSMLGYENDELESTLDTWKKLVHPDDRDRILGIVDTYLAGGSESFEEEMRMLHKDGHTIFVLSRAYGKFSDEDNKPIRLAGTHIDISALKRAEIFNKKTADILEMVARGLPASKVYNAIALMYEERHPGMRCSMLELEGNKLRHGGAPSLPKEYCDAVDGLENGPDVGSCGTSTFTGKRCLVENIETNPKWEKIKHIALPHGMRCCWSEPAMNSQGKVLGAFGMYYDHPSLPNEEQSNDLKSAARLTSIVMERDQNQKLIHKLAYTDELTGLSSRAHFYLYMEDFIKSSERYNRDFNLLYIDLDNFKDVNDSLGHDVGDQLLKEISERIKSACRETDFVTRLGGDEFSIISEGSQSPFAMSTSAQRCIDAITAPITISGRTLIPACSIGIAHYPSDGKTLSSLLKAADTALYSAKESGKGRYAFYESELTEKAEYRFKFEYLLREAIDKQQLSLAYQPQINTFTGEVIGIEALSRWYHPELGQVPPLKFIASAEKIGMLDPLTEWVLYTACRQLAKWKSSGIRPVRIAVNISPNQFLDKNFITLVRKVIDETGINPSDLELEVTENVVQTEPENLAVFNQLKELGVLLAIDDFGIGYSSFSSLKHLNVDCLKIDKYFINDILENDDSKLLVSSMIELGHNFNSEVIAEGVETEEQLNLIKKLGCETAQGYLFSKPVPENEVPALIRKQFL